jgi:hypothetical protein
MEQARAKLSMPRIVPEAGEPVFVPEPKAEPGAAAPVAEATAPAEAVVDAPVADAASPAAEAGGESQPEQA